ncbi:MAG: hypothetical protein QM831_21200 [Kofleriaceae bacterium]
MLRLIVLLVLAGCWPQASRPYIPRHTACDPQQVYDAGKLAFRDGVFGETFERSDDSYGTPELRRVFAQYPKSDDLRRTADLRRSTIAALASLGVIAALTPIAHNASASMDQQWSRGEQAIGYGVGAALVATSILTALLWHDPIDHIAETYNGELAADIEATCR